jgi:hypothetical protein
LNTSTTTRPIASALAVGLCLAVVGSGCGFGQSGIEPPSDRIFFPAGITVDPAGDWLYVVNSNSDLRFNAGTVVAVDLRKAREDRDPAKAWGRCPSSVFAEPPTTPDGRFCCLDFIDERIRNCDERGYVFRDATVSIGSFGGTIKLQSYLREGQPVRRLFVAVRAEPSLTFIDVAPSNGTISMRCTPEDRGPNPFCDDAFRVKSLKKPDGTEVRFPEEPHAMVLDDQLGVLYVGHLGGVDRNRLVARGVSVVNVCNPADPASPPGLASVLDDALPRSGSIGVTSLTPAMLGDPTAPLYATGELVSEIAELVFRFPERVACGSPERNLELVAGRRFSSAAFGTRGGDLRGLVLAEQREQAFVLHRQYAVRGEFNPPSVVAIDRRPDSSGLPLNRPVGVVEVCNGPNRLLEHDAGRGPHLFVNCFEGGQIYVVEPNLLTVEAVIEVGAGPAELVFAPNDPTVAFVAGFASNNVSVIDLRPGSPTEFRVIQRIGFARSQAVPK